MWKIEIKKCISHMLLTKGVNKLKKLLEKYDKDILFVTA